MPPVAVAPRTPPAVDLEALVRRHQVALWRYLRALGCEAALADDLLQDTFLVAFRRLSDAGDDVAVAAFLRRTGRHLFLRRRRDAGRR
ncbi:MAG: sigma-70 family RNA polymerase sigma factor, partial [Planctomycetes bacterium]|nr:sigma-70 family RNA polymerase sigma factor [Planctomycetota bacterium]